MRILGAPKISTYGKRLSSKHCREFPLLINVYRDGRTSLHHAVNAGQTDMVELLIQV